MDITQRQPQLTTQFEHLIAQKHLHHAYLFHGAKGVGKKEMAVWLAQSLFCENPDENHGACGVCKQCTRIATMQHPDVVQIEPEGQSIKIDEIRFLKTELSKSGMESAQKVFIIDDAEKMTVSAANSLLKFIEEPSQTLYIFLLTTAKGKILPTILSRCQAINFPRLRHEAMQKMLEEKGVASGQASLLARLTQDVEQAEQMAQDEWFAEAKEKVINWFKLLLNKDEMAFIWVQQEFVPVFKEKDQQTLALDLLLLAYQDLLFYQSQASQAYSYPNLLDKVYEKSTINLQAINACLEEILQCKPKLDANVGVQGVFEQLTLHLLGEIVS